jgi:hypothetical protein
MAHAQKPDFIFRRNGRVHLNRRGRQFSRLLPAEVCASAIVMLDAPCSEVAWRVLATHSIRRFPRHFPSRASPCAITFQLDCSIPHHTVAESTYYFTSQLLDARNILHRTVPEGTYHPTLKVRTILSLRYVPSYSSWRFVPSYSSWRYVPSYAEGTYHRTIPEGTYILTLKVRIILSLRHVPSYSSWRHVPAYAEGTCHLTFKTHPTSHVCLRHYHPTY